MKNRDMPAKPIPSKPIFDSRARSYDDYNTGLTKLEYAAIHILAGMEGGYRYNYVDTAVMRANQLFDELEKQGGDQ